jgi:hypothetical protein
VPETATVSDGASGFSQEMADAVVAAAETSPQASPEREFAERWAVGEDFLSAFDDLLARYYEAVRGRLGTQAGFDDYFALAESRRRRGIEEMPIFRENPLLFAHSNVPPARRAMRADGSVA